MLKHVFQNPDEAAKHLNDHPFFKKFVARPSTETYIEGLCDSLQSLCIGSPVKRSSVKRRLIDILTEEESSEEEVVEAPAKRQGIWNSDSEDDALPATSTLSVAVAQRSSSSKKKSKKQKKVKMH